jgi:hypothetical protein
MVIRNGGGETNNKQNRQASKQLRQSNTPRDGRSDPPSLTSASVMVHQHLLPLVSLQPRHRSTSNQKWSLQAQSPHTPTFRLVNRGTMGRPAQVWTKSDVGANFNLYVRQFIPSLRPSGWHSAVGCLPACLCPSKGVLTSHRQSQIRFAGFAYTPPGGIRLFAVRSIFFLQLLSQPASTIASHLYLTIY